MELWKAGSEIRSLMRDVVAKWHPDLADFVDRIAIVMRDPAAKSGGVVTLGNSKKASPLVRILGENEFVFVLELAASEWVDLSDRQRAALIDHLLCGCGVKEDDKKKGGIAFFLKKPEIQMFKAEVRRHGVWMDISEDDDDGDLAATALEELFSSKGKDDTKISFTTSDGKTIETTSAGLVSLTEKLSQVIDNDTLNKVLGTELEVDS